ncbi:MAG: alginate export family protein [Vicinamibacterales bacterium]|nr:alginate export family protein [Vicinamibacterales bacterium]
MRQLLRPVIVILIAALVGAASPARAQQGDPAAKQAPAAAKPPLPNRLNSVMPAWLRVRGEFRERVEGVSNAGFNESRDDLYYLTRLRLNIAATGKYAGATVQVQDARVAQKTVGPTGAPFRAPFDVRQAFLDLGTAKSPVTMRIGRQELAYGDQRLVGHVSWLNAARTFDAAKATFRSKALSVDLFGASVVRILPTELDRSGAGNRFAGVYASSGRVVPKGTVEPYLFWRRDQNLRPEAGGLATLNQFTTGARLVGKTAAALDYNIEMALQSGSLGGDTVRAWAGHWQLRRTLTGTYTPHVTGEYNFASGDANPADGTRGTFDQLFPTPHDKTGLSDQIGWKNIHHLRVGVDVTPFKATPVTVNYHAFWLVEPRDALYAVNNAVVARMPTGAPRRSVGREIDVQVSRPLTPQLAMAVGYSHLFTGPFLKAATPGASYSGPYAMLTYVFLAEK